MSTLLQELKQLKEDDAPAPQAVQAAADPGTTPAAAGPATPVAPAVAAVTPPLAEEEEYGDSSEFTEEFYDIIQKAKDAEKILKSTKFKHWIGVTDQNFGTQCTPATAKVVTAIDAFIAAFNELDVELEKAA